MFYVNLLLVISSLFYQSGAVDEPCEDFEGNVVEHGMYYVPGPNVCSQCVCYHGEPEWCKMMFCHPPYHCLQWVVGTRCCEFTCLEGPAANVTYSEINGTFNYTLETDADGSYILSASTAILMLMCLASALVQ